MVKGFVKEQEFYKAKSIRERIDAEKRHFEKFKKQYQYLEFEDVIAMSETRVKMKMAHGTKVFELHKKYHYKGRKVGRKQ